jgi:hypothetical protein
MGAPSPELCNVWLARAFNAQDVEAAAAMYHPEASIVQVDDVHGEARIARGAAGIRKTMAAYIGLKPHMDVVTHHITVAGRLDVQDRGRKAFFRQRAGRCPIARGLVGRAAQGKRQFVVVLGVPEQAEKAGASTARQRPMAPAASLAHHVRRRLSGRRFGRARVIAIEAGGPRQIRPDRAVRLQPTVDRYPAAAAAGGQPVLRIQPSADSTCRRFTGLSRTTDPFTSVSGPPAARCIRSAHFLCRRRIGGAISDRRSAHSPKRRRNTIPRTCWRPATRYSESSLNIRYGPKADVTAPLPRRLPCQHIHGISNPNTGPTIGSWETMLRVGGFSRAGRSFSRAECSSRPWRAR